MASIFIIEEVTHGGPMWESHPNAEKLLMKAANGGPIQASHPNAY